jgi:hypothetical protein
VAADEFMPCRQCDVPNESIIHILLECKTSGQQKVWKMARELWTNTGLDWPHMTIGLILGIGLYEIKTRGGTWQKEQRDCSKYL